MIPRLSAIEAINPAERANHGKSGRSLVLIYLELELWFELLGGIPDVLGVRVNH